MVSSNTSVRGEQHYTDSLSLSPDLTLTCDPSYELVLADGSVKTCSAQDDPDLFHAVPWSYGTLGFLVSVEIEIIPSKRFVKLDYWPVYSMDQMIETFEKKVESVDAADFVECLVYSPDRVRIS